MSAESTDPLVAYLREVGPQVKEHFDKMVAALAAQSEPAADEPTCVPVAPRVGAEAHTNYNTGESCDCDPEPAADEDNSFAEHIDQTYADSFSPPEPADQGEGWREPPYIVNRPVPNYTPHTPAPPADRTPDAATLPDTPHTTIRAQTSIGTGLWWSDHKGEWSYPGSGRKVPQYEIDALESCTILAEPPKGDAEPDEALPLTPEETDYTDFLTQMVAQSEAHATARAKRYADVAEDRAVRRSAVTDGSAHHRVRVQAEQYTDAKVAEAVDQLRGEIVGAASQVHNNKGVKSNTGYAFGCLAEILAQSGQQHTEKENDA